MFYTSSVAHTGRHLHARENGSREMTIDCKHPKKCARDQHEQGNEENELWKIYGNKGREHDEKTRCDHFLQGRSGRNSDAAIVVRTRLERVEEDSNNTHTKSSPKEQKRSLSLQPWCWGLVDRSTFRIISLAALPTDFIVMALNQ